jgi:acyl carrier protein
VTRDKFLLEMDEIIGLPAGRLHGDERLEDLEGWDSLALITVIQLVESVSRVRVTPNQIVNCATVADVLRLAQVEGNAA